MSYKWNTYSMEKKNYNKLEDNYKKLILMKMFSINF
jgi:hypothetical protein